MAFQPINFTLWSNFQAPGNPNNLPQWWGYLTVADTIANVSASGYFNYDNGALLQNSNIRIGDLIYCVCTDGNLLIQVTAISPNITTALPPADIAPGTITTAMLGNNIVTAAKIANGTITTTQISGTAAITGAQLAAGANIAGSQLAAAANIAGTQLAAAANIAGSQLAAAAGIVGTQLANNTVASGQLDLSTIQYVKVPMTAAQWNGMYAAPFQLIAAPGAGLAIIVRGLALAMTFVSASYAAGGAVICQYDSTQVHGAGINACGTSTIAAAAVNGFGASDAFGLAGQLPVAGAAQSTFVNKNLCLSNASGAFTTGDGTWNIHIWYEIVTL